MTPVNPVNPTNPTDPVQPMNLEDPRISAWLMPDAAAMSAEDRAAVEAALVADPQLAAAVEQLRALTAQLETHYQSAAYVDEADLLLDQGRRAAILAADPADADAAALAAADAVTSSRAPRRSARPAVATLSNISRWDRQPWFVRLAAIAAAFWLLGMPMLRWGGAQLLYRTGVGRGIIVWLDASRSTSGHDRAAKRSGDGSVERMFGLDGPPSLLDYVLRRDEVEMPGLVALRRGTSGEVYPGSDAVVSIDREAIVNEQPVDAADRAAAAMATPIGATGEYRESVADAPAFQISPTGIAPDQDGYGYAPPAGIPAAPGGEGYQSLTDNPFKPAEREPLSTFSIDVDTASYSNVRRYLAEMGQLPPADAVRIEELLNSFSYADAPPPVDGPEPFAVHVELGPAPWAPRHRLLRIAMKGKEIPPAERPDGNLVFLVDVSGSMQDANKLPLVKASLGMLVEELGARDSVSMVVYAGSSGLVLPPTRGDDRRAILEAIERLEAGGSTNGGEGIELAYRLARERFVRGGANRVILMTDGDFNVGLTDRGSLEQLITEEARSGVFLTVLGFGMGNLKDDTLELLADKGNGNYGYIDGRAEARRLLVEQLSGTLVTIAKDVKIQLEFNPRAVAYWRQIGYENRALAAQDFNDDRKDAGEIGAGHSVIALYELVPPGELPGEPQSAPGIDPLRYGGTAPPADRPGEGLVDFGRPINDRPADELLFLKLRYKAPEGDSSRLLETPVRDAGRRLDQTSPDFRFAAGVAAFGMLLRQSPYRGAADWAMVDQLAEQGQGRDADGYRQGFRDLVRLARRLSD
jgi:Ca-activated chloride channel family protein